jgi:hypothetical protein
MRAIGVVLQTEIFVNLQERLLMSDGFGKTTPSWIVAEQSRGGGFEAAIAQTRRQLGIVPPNVDIVGAPEREDYIRQDLGDARIADECHRFWGSGSCQRVTEFPERVIERSEKIFNGAGRLLPNERRNTDHSRTRIDNAAKRRCG